MHISHIHLVFVQFLADRSQNPLEFTKCRNWYVNEATFGKHLKMGAGSAWTPLNLQATSAPHPDPSGAAGEQFNWLLPSPISGHRDSPSSKHSKPRHFNGGISGTKKGWWKSCLWIEILLTPQNPTPWVNAVRTSSAGLTLRWAETPSQRRQVGEQKPRRTCSLLSAETTANATRRGRPCGREPSDPAGLRIPHFLLCPTSQFSPGSRGAGSKATCNGPFPETLRITLYFT